MPTVYRIDKIVVPDEAHVRRTRSVLRSQPRFLDDAGGVLLARRDRGEPDK